MIEDVIRWLDTWSPDRLGQVLICATSLMVTWTAFAVVTGSWLLLTALNGVGFVVFVFALAVLIEKAKGRGR
jgi:hypothetical protein